MFQVNNLILNHLTIWRNFFYHLQLIVLDIMRTLLTYSYFSTYNEIWWPPDFPLLSCDHFSHNKENLPSFSFLNFHPPSSSLFSFIEKGKSFLAYWTFFLGPWHTIWQYGSNPKLRQKNTTILLSVVPQTCDLLQTTQTGFVQNFQGLVKVLTEHTFFFFCEFNLFSKFCIFLR